MWAMASALMILLATTTCIVSSVSKDQYTEYAVFFGVIAIVFAAWDVRDQIKKGS
jgi:Na+/melibiose symporter-like transporter